MNIKKKFKNVNKLRECVGPGYSSLYRYPKRVQCQPTGPPRPATGPTPPLVSATKVDRRYMDDRQAQISSPG